MASRTTIDFGIDLGTTNSTIAVIDGIDAKVIPNKQGSTVTPSAVWINPRGNLYVGKEAKERTLNVEGEGENGDLEFKLRMGSGEEGKKVFARSGREMRPEDLSAEVLKSLKTDVRSSMGEEVGAAVITVPAAFEQAQTYATGQAARLAGFASAPLLPEPVAASLAYGFQSENENAYWFVYDFGGGTFDAALMRVRDGLIQVVNHNGDNFLGGKLIDWGLVDKYLIPTLAKRFKLPRFGRGNDRWKGAMGRLKYWVEEAKIEVCRTGQEVEVYIEHLCDDAAGKPVEVVYTLTPEAVEAVSRPYIERSLGLCRRTLEEKGLKGSSLDRVLMVGGSTLSPWVREAVAAELGAPLEFGIDPVTVVARGAAIFASTQPAPIDPTVAVPLGTWRLEVHLAPVGTEVDPDIGGRVIPEAGASAAGCTIELRDKKTQWSSGRILLDEYGAFMTQLVAERGRRCEFEIFLLDPTGRRIRTQPESVPYTLGLSTDKSPCMHSLSIGLADGTVGTLIPKGKLLPAKGQTDRRTTVPLRAGHPEDRVRIPVVEGENPRVERNHLSGDLIITGTEIQRDLPMGSKVEIAMTMDASMHVKVTAYVQHLDQDFEVEFDVKMGSRDPQTLRQDLDAQKARLATIARDAGPANPDAAQALDRIAREGMVGEAESLAQAATQDQDALTQLDRRLLDLAAAIDSAEDATAWPKVLAEAEETRDLLGKVIRTIDKVTAADRATHQALEAEMARAIASREEPQVRRIIEDMDDLRIEILRREPGWWLARLEYAEEHLSDMTDRAQAQRLIAQGNRSVANNDIEGLQAAIRQLWSLFRRDLDPAPIPGGVHIL